jgi:hypothetical protein
LGTSILVFFLFICSKICMYKTLDLN